MEAKKIRLLRADEIECRVDAIYDTGISLLLYTSARVVQNIMDETFGIYGWNREHKIIGDAMFCTVSIRDENGICAIKTDVGSPSYAEPLKGACSDSFKRACTNIGIAREWYSLSGGIFIPIDKVEIRDHNGKKRVKDSFHVSAIQYNEQRRIITELEIKNKKDDIVFTYGMKQKTQPKDERQNRRTKEKKLISWEQEETLRRLMNRKGVSEAAICRRYVIPRIQDMDEQTLERAMRALEVTADIAA